MLIHLNAGIMVGGLVAERCSYTPPGQFAKAVVDYLLAARFGSKPVDDVRDFRG